MINNPLAVYTRVNQFEAIPKLIKVKAHAGNGLNEEADKQEKFATWVREETHTIQHS
jgi:hypothetical protein